MRVRLSLEPGEVLKCKKCERELNLASVWVVVNNNGTAYWAFCSPDCLAQQTIEDAWNWPKGD